MFLIVVVFYFNITMSIPPTVAGSLGSLHSKTYHSEIPASLLSTDEEIILGVDEAGRGPVMGPMVYGISYCTRKSEKEVVCKYGFDDSKKLTDQVRQKLFAKIYNGEIDGIGYATTAITACDISSGMLRFPPEKNYNLNQQAHDVTISLIDDVLKSGVKIGHVYVDTVGPPSTYQKKLEERFPQCKITVAKKADSIYPIVSVASVVAKVTRDVILIGSKKTPDEILGSGYPGDAKTVQWLKQEMTPLMGWSPYMVRFSWQTCETMLSKSSDTVPIEWEEDAMTKKKMQWAPEIKNKPISLDSWYQ